MTMQWHYDLSATGLQQMINDALKEYDPRDVMLANGMAALCVYIVRYTDSVEAAVDAGTDLLKTTLNSPGGQQMLGVLGSAAAGLVPK